MKSCAGGCIAWPSTQQWRLDVDSPYVAHIAAAFGIATVVLFAIAAAIVFDYRRLRRELARLGDERDQS